jgi:hypothetical protein
MQYIIPLLGGSAAAIGAAFFGNSIKQPVEELPAEQPVEETSVDETPVEQEVEQSVEEAPVEEPPIEQEVEQTVEQPVEEPPVEQSGGAFGRPSWQPYDLSKPLSPVQSVSAVVSNIVQSIPSNSAAIQQELSKVTTDWENASYELYNLGVKQKTILDKMNGTTGNPGIREVYRTAFAKVNAGKIQVNFLTKQIEDYDKKVDGKNGFEVLKNFFGDRIEKTDDEKRNLNDKSHKTYLARIDDIVKKSSNSDVEEFKRSNSDSLDKWWGTITSNKKGSSSSKPKLEELVERLTKAEKDIYTNEDIVSENKDEYDRLSAELTDIRSKRVEKEKLKSSLNERRLALINALSKTDKSISDVTTRFRPVSDTDLKNILLEYNKALLDLDQREKELKVWYIQNYMNASDKAPKEAEFNAKKKEVEDAKQTVEQIRIQLSGQSSQEASPLDTIIFELKKNGVKGTVALTNLVPIFDMYYEISKQSTPSKVVENLTKYYNMFMRGFDDKLVDEAFVYVSELSKRSTETQYSGKLNDFIEKNKTIVYNAYANLQLTKDKIEKGANPTEALNTSEAVKALLEGKTITQYRLTKSKNVFNWGKTNEQKIVRLVENFGKKVVDKLETAKVGRYWRSGLEVEVQLEPKKEVSERVTELVALFNVKNAELIIPTEDSDVAAYRSKVEQLRSIAQQLKLLLLEDDPVVPMLNDLLKEGFSGGALSSENQKIVDSLASFKTKADSVSTELATPGNRKPVVNIERLMRETIKSKIEEINFEYNRLYEYMLKTAKEQDKSIYSLRLIKPKILNLHNKILKFKEFLSKIGEEKTKETIDILTKIDKYIEEILIRLNDESASDEITFKLPELSIKLPDISAWIPKISFEWFWNFFKSPEPIENKDSTEYPSPEVESIIGQITKKEAAAEEAQETSTSEEQRAAAGTGLGGNHHTRRHWIRSKPSRFKTQRTY